MDCLNEKCLIYKKDKPVYDIVIFYPDKINFCSTACKNNTILEYLKEDIDHFIFLEKYYEECPMCSECQPYLVELSCYHKICTKCVNKVFNTANKCPMCRIVMLLKSENESDENYIENISIDHSYICEVTMKLISSIDFQFNKDVLDYTYFNKTSRNLDNDLEIILNYFNMLKK
jgi:hypothetical protein